MSYGLLGHPLGHSLSPRLHAMLARLSRGEGMDYRLYDIPPEQLDDRLPGLLSLSGFNITIPYKQVIIPWLDQLDETAARIGSVNTVVQRGGGTVGYNTDCIGFLRAVGGLPGIEIAAIKQAVVLGAGGTGRMCAAELARAGARVTIGARESSIDRAAEVARDIERQGGAARAVRIEELGRCERRWDLLVNATPCGMFPNTQACPAEDRLIQSCGAVFDCVYNPMETFLVRRAKKAGIPAAGGLRMLVWQAAAAQEIWMGTVFHEELSAQAEDALARLLTAGA